MRNYLNSHEKTDSTQIRLYDLQVELSIRTLALDGYAQYTNAFDEAAAAEVFKE